MSERVRYRCGHRAPASGRVASARPVFLAEFSTRLPTDLLERLCCAATQLGLRQADITATALDEFLTREGF